MHIADSRCPCRLHRRDQSSGDMLGVTWRHARRRAIACATMGHNLRGCINFQVPSNQDKHRRAHLDMAALEASLAHTHAVSPSWDARTAVIVIYRYLRRSHHGSDCWLRASRTEMEDGGRASFGGVCVCTVTHPRMTFLL